MDNDTPKAAPVGEKIFAPSAKIVKREAYEAAQEARDVIALAQEKARQILEEAERGRDAVLERARQEGIAKGLAEWNHILAQTAQRAQELAQGWEEAMLRLSIRVAEKIIGEQLKLRPETTVAIVREALAGVRPGKHLVIQVNEAEAQAVRARVAALKESLSASSEVEIVASASVSPGGCVIESELGIVDARLETQLKCLEEALVRGVSAD
jgi:type III secretion system HrpE/YscL family protein